MTVEVERGPPPPLDADQLENLQLLQDYAADTPWVPTLFAAKHSLRWFLRQHRDELVGDGAMVKLRSGSWAVHRGRFPATVARILGVAAP